MFPGAVGHQAAHLKLRILGFYGRFLLLFFVSVQAACGRGPEHLGIGGGVADMEQRKVYVATV